LQEIKPTTGNRRLKLKQKKTISPKSQKSSKKNAGGFVYVALTSFENRKKSKSAR